MYTDVKRRNVLNHGIRKVDLPFTMIVRAMIKKLNVDNVEVYAYGTRTKRGFAKYNRRTITVPLWTYGKGMVYFQWYCAHELAHIYAYVNAGCKTHGPIFMEWLRLLCPVESVSLEHCYKPGNAMAAGIPQMSAELKALAKS